MESDKEYTLVLSIFKGVNFVVKKHGGLTCKIVCRVNDSILDSQICHLLTSSTEPEFNYQAAWKLSKKELQELRLKREVVKIECHLLNKSGKTESILGYCTVSVKDAIEIVNYDQIDVKNAKRVPLKGTKQPWISFGPKLLLILHFENHLKGVVSHSKRKMVIPKSPQKTEPKFKAPLPPPASMNVPHFSWSVNHEMGYFQLGRSGPNDDLYIMNITLVNVENLDHLLNPKPAELDDLDWRIRFNCFGMTIDSDIFKLNCSTQNGLTYLGDKSTGRVRASENEFNRFLSGFMLEMQIETIRGTKSELQGTAWTELISLLDPEVFEVRSVIDVVPEKLATVPEHFSPQLTHIIDVNKCPRFFANYVKLEEISFTGQNITTSKEDLSKIEYQDDIIPRKSIRFQPEIPQNDYHREVDVDVIKAMRDLEISEVGAGDENSTRFRPSVIEDNAAPIIEPKISNAVVEETTQYPTTTPLSITGQSVPNSASTHASSASASSTVQTVATTTSRKDNVTSVATKSSFKGNHSSGSSAVQSVGNCCPPGDYDLSLKFSEFNIKANVPLKDGWTISFYHPPLSVEIDDRCELSAKIKKIQDKVHTFYFEEDENENWGLTIPKFSSEILKTPLKIMFYSSPPGTESSLLNHNEPIGYAEIPLGSIFTAKKVGHLRKLEGSAKICRKSDNPIKIGYLYYDFTLSEKKDRLHYEQDYNTVNDLTVGRPRSPELCTPVASESKSNSRRSNQKTSISEKSDPVRLDNEERLFKERLKEKEKAYLQMLSQEHKKQKEESERAVNEKLSELEAKKVEYGQKLRSIQEREEKLKAKEIEMVDSTRTNSLESAKVIEELRMKIKRFEAEKDIKVSAVTKRLDTALTDLEIARGKILVLEKKLEAKDEEIFKLKAERGNWPEAETIRKLDSLQQENIQLKKELTKALEEKEMYRKQTQKIAKELQLKSEESHAQLRTENDNLKLHMLAAREHELLNRDIQQVANVSNEIRLIKDNMEREKCFQRRPDYTHQNNATRARSRPGDGDFNEENIYRMNSNEFMKDKDHEKYIDTEIERLTKSREGLLKTQAYTPYDSLIKNIEAEILKFLEQKNDLIEKREGKHYELR